MTGNKGCVNTSVGTELPDSKRASLVAVKLQATGSSTEHPLSVHCLYSEHWLSMAIQLLVTTLCFVFACFISIVKMCLRDTLEFGGSLLLWLVIVFYYFALIHCHKKSKWQTTWRPENKTWKEISTCPSSVTHSNDLVGRSSVILNEQVIWVWAYLLGIGTTWLITSSDQMAHH